LAGFSKVFLLSSKCLYIPLRLVRTYLQYVHPHNSGTYAANLSKLRPRGLYHLHSFGRKRSPRASPTVATDYW